MRPLPPVIAAATLLILAACASAPRPAEPSAAAREPAPLRAGARDAVVGFVEAIDRRDGKAAAAFIDWYSWVGDDRQVMERVASLRAGYGRRPLSPEEASSRPIQDSTVTLAEILDDRTMLPALARAARERFEAGLAADFPAGGGDAKLVAWHEDSRETSATVRMPDATIVEFVIVGVSGRYRLIPRW